MNKKWLVIIIIITLILLMGSYLGYRHYTKYTIIQHDTITEYDVITNCYKNIDSCWDSHKMGANIICPLCCDKNGEEVYDGSRLDECIKRK